MAEPSDKDNDRVVVIRMLALKRKGNVFVRVASLRKIMEKHGYAPEDVGTTEEELQKLFKDDCRWQVEGDLLNWRLTNSIGCPEKCFAEGVIEGLEKGELNSEEFGITEQELEDIRKTAGLG